MRKAIIHTIIVTLLAAASLASSPAWAQADSWTAYEAQAAQQIMDANQNDTYYGEPPVILASIPVLQIDLNADGTVRHIKVVREPENEPQTAQYAIDAVMRAAPFPDVSSMPKPWRFNETFLYDWALRFQLRALQP